MSEQLIIAIIELVWKYGIPGAEKIYKTIANSEAPTDEMWQKLKAINTTIEDKMRAAGLPIQQP